MQYSWCSTLRSAFLLSSAVCLLHGATGLEARQLLDKVLARIGTTAVTLTEVRAAVGLGLVEVKPGENAEAVGLERVIERQIVLNEVARFPPPEPTAAEVAEQVAAMKAHAGASYDRLAASAGLDETRLQELARQTLRVRAYTTQRFGTMAQVTEEEARKYFDDHPEQFTRNGVRLSFEQAAPAARQRASAERLGNTIDEWIRDLRARADVVIVGSGKPSR
jgi:hypothetical protein